MLPSLRNEWKKQKYLLLGIAVLSSLAVVTGSLMEPALKELLPNPQQRVVIIKNGDFIQLSAISAVFHF